MLYVMLYVISSTKFTITFDEIVRKVDCRLQLPRPLNDDLKFSPPVRAVGVCVCTNFNLRLLRLSDFE